MSARDGAQCVLVEGETLEVKGQPAAPTGCFQCGDTGLETFLPHPLVTKTLTLIPIPAPMNSFKKPRRRPKLTPEILLSDDGLGYVLRHFHRVFKYHCRNHEVEQVGASRRVRRCMDELRERVGRRSHIIA